MLPEAAKRQMLLGVGREPDAVTPRLARLADYLRDLRYDYEELLTEREVMRTMLQHARRENVQVCRENAELCQENADLCEEISEAHGGGESDRIIVLSTALHEAQDAHAREVQVSREANKKSADLEDPSSIL